MNLHPKSFAAIRWAHAFTLHRLTSGGYWIEAHRLASANTRGPGFKTDAGIHRDYVTNRTYRLHETGHGKGRKITLTPDGYYDGEPICTADGELVTFDTAQHARRWIDTR